MTPVEAMRAYAAALGLEITYEEWTLMPDGDWVRLACQFNGTGNHFVESGRPKDEMLHSAIMAELRRLGGRKPRVETVAWVA